MYLFFGTKEPLDEVSVTELWKRPILDLDARRQLTGYRSIPIDTRHAWHYEPLVNLRDYDIKCRSYYHGSGSRRHPNNPPYNERLPHSLPDVWVRASVAERLRHADRYLRKCNRRLVVLDGYRSAKLQDHLRNVWWPKHLRLLNPKATDEEIESKLAGFLAHARTNPLEPSPHLTGGAIDLTIEWCDGTQVDMGTAPEDPSPLARTDAFESQVWGKGRGINLEVVHNRRMLYWTMLSVGFWNYPDEWWHYMFGDQMWAQQEAHEKDESVSAFYSCAEPPPMSPRRWSWSWSWFRSV